jgi:hypothetical protein
MFLIFVVALVILFLVMIARDSYRWKQKYGGVRRQQGRNANDKGNEGYAAGGMYGDDWDNDSSYDSGGSDSDGGGGDGGGGGD